jgi:hypothetical protein
MSFTGVVLALDLATVTGWAAGRPGDTPTFGSVRLNKPGGSRATAYRAFRTWLDAMPSMPDLIIYELPMQPLHMKLHTNIDTSKLLMGLAEHLEEWALGKTELREATVGQVRAHFIGQNLKSAIAKPKTVQTCIDRGWPVTTTDEADACALWDYQVSWLRPDIAVANTPLFRVHT